MTYVYRSGPSVTNAQLAPEGGTHDLWHVDTDFRTRFVDLNWHPRGLDRYGWVAHLETIQGLDGTLYLDHGGDQRERILVSVPPLFAITRNRHHLSGRAFGCYLCPLWFEPCRGMAADLRRHRNDFALPECVRFDFPTF